MRIRILILLGVLIQSCSLNYTEIEGKSESQGMKKLCLYAYREGRADLLDTLPVNSDGSFAIRFKPPYEGFYLLGENDKFLFPFYLRGGEVLKLSLNDATGLKLLETNSLENTALYQWEEKAWNLRFHAYLFDYVPGGRSVAPEMFFEELEELQAAAGRWNNVDTKNEKFDALFTAKRNADMHFYSLSYWRKHDDDISDTLKFSDYYREMEPDKVFQNKTLLSLPFVGHMLETYVWYKRKSEGVSSVDLKQNVAYLQEPGLQQEYLLAEAEHFKYFGQYEKMRDDFGQTFFSSANKERLKKIEKKLEWSKPGIQAPDFKGMAVDSSWISLSDFKGKVVVVDVWATWCEPCKRMMPYFKQLEKEMKGEDVVFFSVCMGASIERGSWLRIIEQEHLEGNLVFIDSWLGEFAGYYRITGVPRFMVFDRSGRIVSVAAPFPNKPELKKMIRETLESGS